MFKFSISKDLVHFKPVNANSIDDLNDAILTSNWSPSIYQGNYRNLKNFIQTEIIALDIDEGLSLEKAFKIFGDYKHIIATTRSHQKEKNGKVCDRFRVILFLDRPITDARTFGATWQNLADLYPFIDPQAKDASRFFYPCEDIESYSPTGDFVSVVEAPPEVERSPKIKALTSDQKGRLARSTLEFLLDGAPKGFWNSTLYKAARDFYQNGYGQEEFTERALQIEGYLDEGSYKTIESAFSKEPKHEPRIKEASSLSEEKDLQTEAGGLVVKASDLRVTTFNYLENKELVKGEPTGLKGLDEALGGGKRLGEVTALVASGKTGKNALYHYLMHLWIQKGIPMAYASRELDPATEVVPDLLSMTFQESARLVELDEEKKILYQDEIGKWLLYFAEGRGYFPEKDLNDWVRQLKEKGVSYFWFDHLHWMLEDPEEYKLASLLSRQLSDLAKKQNIHIDIIIQPKILMEGERPSLNSMKGGSAIGQNINNLLTLERVIGQKNISRLSLKAARSRLATLSEIYLEYNPVTLSFTEVEPKAEESEEDSEEESNVTHYNFNQKVLK